MISSLCKAAPEEVKIILNTKRFYKHQSPQKVPDYYLHSLKNVTVDGLWLEFGVWVGTSINLLASIMDYLGKGSETIYGFDSFEGLPEDWVDPLTGKIQTEGKKGHFNLDGRMPIKRFKNIEFVKGWFDKSVPEFMKDKKEKIAFLHIDSDLYSSAKIIFDNLEKNIVPGTVIMFDEFYNYDGYEAHEYKAFKEFVERNNVTYEWISHVASPGRQASLIIKSIDIR